MAALLAVTTPAQAVASLSSRICIICTILRTPKRTNPNRCSAVSSISCIFCMKSLTVWNRHTFSHGDLMTANRLARWAGVGALFGLVCPLALAAQGVPAAPAALAADSLARAANAAAAANTVAINFVWTLVTGFLVMFMQAGFAMVETGFTRAKNAAHTFAMNFMVYGIGMLAYWAVGFALQAGGLGPMATLGGFDKLNQEFSLHIAGKTWGLFGHSGFFLTGVAYAAPVHLLPVPDGVHGHGGHHSYGGDGRAVEVLGVRGVQRLRRGLHLPAVRELDLGRRLDRKSV